MDNRHLKRPFHLWGMGNTEDLTTHNVDRLWLRQRQNDTHWFMSVPQAMVPSSSLLLSQSIILCVLPHLQRKVVARLPTAMTDGSVRLHVCVCFLLLLLLRGVSARRNQYRVIVLPTHLIQQGPQGWNMRTKSRLQQFGRTSAAFSCRCLMT